MKNLLLNLAFSVTTILRLVININNQTTKIIDNQSLLVRTQQNINKIFLQSKRNYCYIFQIHVNHDTLNNWNSS